jgi:hypothetical protein
MSAGWSSERAPFQRTYRFDLCLNDRKVRYGRYLHTLRDNWSVFAAVTTSRFNKIVRKRHAAPEYQKYILKIILIHML